MIDKLVYDLFLADCDKYLSQGETKLLRLYCGIDTGHPPLDAVRISVMFGRRPEEIKQLTRRALLKLPYRRLQEVHKILLTPDHRYAAGLKPSEHEALRRLVGGGMALHEAVRKMQQHTSAPRVTEATPPPPASTAAAPPAPRVRRPVEELAQLIEQANAPVRLEQLVAQANAHALDLTLLQAKRMLQGSSQIVWYDEQTVLLRHWHNRITSDGRVKLRLCPPLPLGRKTSPEALLEMLVHVSQWLSESRFTYHDLWQQATRHAKLEMPAQDWLDVLFACGVLPDVQYFDVRRSYAEPDAVIAGLSMPERRAKMLEQALLRMHRLPMTLGAIAYSYRPSIEQVAAQTHGAALGLADTLHRVRLLEALGAVTLREPWQITPLGEAALAPYAEVRPQPPAPVIDTGPLDDLDWLSL